MEINYEQVLSRLKIVLEARSDADVARGLEISTAALSSFRKQQKFPYERIVKFCLARDIQVEWLLTGEGSMKRVSDMTIKRPDGSRILIDAKTTDRSSLPDRSSEAPADQPYGEYVYIPQVTGEISAGGGLIADDTIEMRIGFRREWIERKGDHTKMAIIRVKGDSMEPTLMSGDIVLIDHARNFVDPHGGIYAIAFDNEIMVKRVQVLFPASKLRVISDNPKYQPADVDPGTVNINGKVIWFGRELER